jgi:hypothetical protein
MGGSSQPFLAQANDGKKYVIKFAQKDCANFLFNECLGSNLYQLFGLLCPPWKALMLTDEFLDQNPGCWIDSKGLIRPPAGLCFGSQFLGDSETEIYQILPGSWFKKIHNPFDFWRAWFLDICAEHYDTRQALFHERPDRSIQPWFIDHGYMFGGPESRIRGKVMAPRYLDSRIYNETPIDKLSTWVGAAQKLDKAVYWGLLDSIPTDWKTAEAMTGFVRFISRFLDKDFAEIIIKRMDVINQVFLRLRSDGMPAWRAHCYGQFFPTEDTQLTHAMEVDSAAD